jgi:hypothetical protein
MDELLDTKYEQNPTNRSGLSDTHIYTYIHTVTYYVVTLEIGSIYHLYTHASWLHLKITVTHTH